MNYKKIIVMTLVVLAAFTCLSTASAGFLDDMFGSSEPQNITITGIEFTIPADFEEEENMTTTNEVGDDGKIINSKTFSDGLNEFGISVVNYNGEELYFDENAVDGVTYVDKTINGIDGHYAVIDGDHVFIYSKGEKGVTVVSTDESLFEEIIH